MFGRDNKHASKHIGSWANGMTPEGFSPEECSETLNRIPFFAKLRPADRRNLGAAGVARSYPAGATLVHEGQRPGVGLYVILRGRVRLTQQSECDGVRPLAVLGPGEMFGEMALIDEQPRSATATALEPTLALVIPIFDFRAVLQRNAEATTALLAQLSRRVREAEASQRC
jgi:CRP/FNR family transcriptional regulator